MIQPSSELKDGALKILYGVCVFPELKAKHLKRSYGVCEPLPETTSKGVCVRKLINKEVNQDE